MSRQNASDKRHSTKGYPSGQGSLTQPIPCYVRLFANVATFKITTTTFYFQRTNPEIYITIPTEKMIKGTLHFDARVTAYMSATGFNKNEKMPHATDSSKAKITTQIHEISIMKTPQKEK